VNSGSPQRGDGAAGGKEEIIANPSGFRRLCLCALCGALLLVAAACSSKIPHWLVQDYAKNRPRLIAVLPVENRTTELPAARILREKLLTDLYFKGYPKIPLKLVDERLAAYYQGNRGAGGQVPPSVVAKALGVDAILYSTLEECSISYFLWYASITVSMEFELRSAKTGTTLWKTDYRNKRRHFSFFRKELEASVYLDYEDAIRDGLDKVMETIPDGPDVVK